MFDVCELLVIVFCLMYCFEFLCWCITFLLLLVVLRVRLWLVVVRVCYCVGGGWWFTGHDFVVYASWLLIVCELLWCRLVDLMFVVNSVVITTRHNICLCCGFFEM